MAQQTMLGSLLKKSGESDSQENQSSGGTDWAGLEASGSEFSAKYRRSMLFLGWLTEVLASFFNCLILQLEIYGRNEIRK